MLHGTENVQVLLVKILHVPVCHLPTAHRHADLLDDNHFRIMAVTKNNIRNPIAIQYILLNQPIIVPGYFKAK